MSETRNLWARTIGRGGLFALCLWAAALGGCKHEAMDLRQLMPGEVGGWRAESPGRVYDRDTLFEYIDGGAELYLAYGFREMVAGRYQKAGEPDIVVDLFDMGSSDDAFGVFTAELQEPEAGVGQGSEYAAGLLRFWKGRFFASVWAEGETATTESSVLAIGEKIAAAIEPPGRTPQLVRALPERGLGERGIRFFHDHASLNLHYFVADGNILGLSEQTEAVLAPYGAGDSAMRVLVIRYPAAGDAEDALASFLDSYLPEGRRTGMAQVESGTWVGAENRADVVAVVFDAPNEGEARDLLTAVWGRLEDEKR
jgi:hypothetical protein